jgi:hypothetical protein
VDGVEHEERSALLVIRAWRRGDAGFTARLIGIGGLPHGPATTLVTGDADDLVEHVRAWLTHLSS